MGQHGNETFSAEELAAREIRLRKADEWPQFVKPCSHRCMNCETCGADVFVYEHRIRTALKEALDLWEHHRGMTNWDRGTDEDGGEMRRIAELRKEFGV